MQLAKFGVAFGVLAALALEMPIASAHPGFYLVPARVARSIETQTLTISATGGTFKPSAGASAVAYNASADAVRDALEADPAIGYDNVGVTGNAGGPYTVKFQGNLAGANVAQLVPSATGLTGGSSTVVAATLVEGGADVVYPGNFGDMAVQDQYAIANDGYATGIRETNGVVAGGMVNYKMLPTAFRATMTKDQIVAYPQAQTSFQAHATCQGVPALAANANIFAWQNDVFYNYIPWQNTSAGTGGEGDPTKWMAVVQAATGVDLSKLNTVADFTAACTGLGGKYAPSDTLSNISSANVADAVAPLNAQITSLTATNVSLTAANAALTSQNAQLQAALDDATKGDRRTKLAVKLIIEEIDALLRRILRLL